MSERASLPASQPASLVDDDLSRLSPDDLARVTRWVEDRMINAITPLDVRLQMEMPGTMAADPTLQTAQKAVKRIMAAVGELRALARRPRTIDHGPPTIER